MTSPGAPYEKLHHSFPATTQLQHSSNFLLNSQLTVLLCAAMNPTRVLTRAVGCRSLWGSASRRRCISSTCSRFNEREHPNAEEHRKYQKEKPNNPHMTNTSSTITNDMPSLGKDKPPPDMLSSADLNFVPEDRVPENTERMTGGTQAGSPDKVSPPEFGVGEMEGVSFKVEPLRRTGEDLITMRARLLCLCKLKTCPKRAT